MAATLIAPPPVTVSFRTVTCCKCHVPFAMPTSMCDKRIQDRGSFYCPNGHSQVFLGPTEADRLKAKLLQVETDRDYYRDGRDRIAKDLQKTERRLSATRGVITRHKRRIQAGRCTCCSKQFKDLQHHMATQHPNWDPDKHATAMESGS